MVVYTQEVTTASHEDGLGPICLHFSRRALLVVIHQRFAVVYHLYNDKHTPESVVLNLALASGQAT